MRCRLLKPGGPARRYSKTATHQQPQAGDPDGELNSLGNVGESSLLLPQSHNVRLDFGWIAEDAFEEVRIDGIEAVAETDEGGGDV